MSDRRKEHKNIGPDAKLPNFLRNARPYRREGLEFTAYAENIGAGREIETQALLTASTGKTTQESAWGYPIKGRRIKVSTPEAADEIERELQARGFTPQ